MAENDSSNKYLQPDVLARISSLQLRAERVVEGTISGHHVSPFHGVSVEFADYREYSPGDDIRRVDWRVFGRTNRYFIKEFEQESNLRATILMDASASMAYGRGPLSKYDYAATLAASMATLLSRQQDAVGLVLFDDATRTVLRPSTTRAQLHAICDALANSKPERQTELGDAMARVADTVKRRGLIIIISDLLCDLDRFFDNLGRLQYQGHEIIVFHILDPDEIELPFDGSVIFKDIEGEDELFAEPWAFRKDYQEAMADFMADAEQRCQNNAVEYIHLTTDEDLGLALSHLLHARRYRRGKRAAAGGGSS
jgi:uncharacterized protein (DUF58 family)